MVVRADGRRLRASPPEKMDAEDPLEILYVRHHRKTQGHPRHDRGDLVGTYATAKWIFRPQEEDVFWCTADIGWVTGYADVVNGPLGNGAICLIDEGALGTPARDRFRDLVKRPA